MADDEFANGYESGRTAAKRGAGWLAGFAGALVKPAANRIGAAAESARIRAAERAAQRQEAIENRAMYLRSEIVRAEERLKQTRLRAFMVPLCVGVVTLLIARRGLGDWEGAFILAVFSYLAAVVVVFAVRKSRRDNMTSELRRMSRPR